MSLHVWAVPVVWPAGIARTMGTARALSPFCLAESVEISVGDGRYVCYQNRICAFSLFYRKDSNEIPSFLTSLVATKFF